MARIKLIGFETGDLSELNIPPPARWAIDGTVSTPGGAYSIKATDNEGDALTYAYNLSPLGHLFIKCNFRFSNGAAPPSNLPYNIFEFRDSTGAIKSSTVLIHKTDGNWYINTYINLASNTVEALLTPTLSANTWYRIETELTTGSTGAAKQYIDGVLKQNLTNQDYGSTNITQINIGQFYAAGMTSRIHWHDDIELDDAVLPGKSVVIARQLEVGTPTYDAWTKAGGTNVEDVLNDTPFNASTNINSAVALAAQTGHVASFSATQSGHGVGTIRSIDTINAVKVNLIGKTAQIAANFTEVGTAQAGTSTSGGNVTLTFSTAPGEGDIVIVTGGHILRTGSSYGPSTAGYTQIGALQTSGASGTGIAFGAWYKIMGASPDTNVVCNGTSNTAGDGVSYQAKVLRGVSTTTPLDVAATFAGPTTSTNPNPPSITFATGGATVIAAASLISDTNIGSAANYTGQAIGNAAATRPYSATILHRAVANVAEDPPAIGSTGNAWSSGIWFAVTIALRPSPTGPYAGSRAYIRRRLGGADTDTAITLALSDTTYDTPDTVPFTTTLANLNAGEVGVVHGDQTVAQQIEDIWVHASVSRAQGLDVTLGALTALGTGKVLNDGAAAITLGDLTLAGSGAVIGGETIGTFGVTLGALTLAASGDVLVQGTLGITLGALTALGTGKVPVNGTAAVTLGDLTLAATGTAVNQVYTGTANITLDPLTLAATGGVLVSGPLVATEAKDVASFVGAVGNVLGGALAAVEAKDTAVFTGTVLVAGPLIATEAKDVAAFTGQVVINATLAATEAKDVAAFTGSVAWAVILAATEAKDTALFTGGVLVNGPLIATEAKDTALFDGAILSAIAATLAAIEAQDTAAFVISTESIDGIFHAAEAPDLAAFTGKLIEQWVIESALQPAWTLETIGDLSVLRLTDQSVVRVVDASRVRRIVTLSNANALWTKEPPPSSTWTTE